MNTKNNPVGQKDIDELRAQLSGTILQPGSSGFDEARSIWNAMIDRRPALIVRCLGVGDVVTCVNFARQRGITLTIKGGGHNIAGLCVQDGGMMLDMSLMRGVWVDTNARRAHAQAGCILGDVDRETQLHGLAATLGFVSKTGIAGLTVGGGFGYLSRRFGWTSDTVPSMEVVTADGRVVRASESENEDLFWGLRGGGGNFGIVTNFEYELNEVGPEIVAGAVAWPGERAREVLDFFSKVSEDAPPEQTVVAVLRKAPPAPWLPKDIHGKSVIVLVVCDTGPVPEAEKRSERIKTFGAPVGDVLQRRAYSSQQSLLDATQPSGRRYYWKSEYLAGLNGELLDKATEHAGRIASPHSAVIFFPLDGAIQNLPEDHSAVGNRDAKVVMNITGSWELPGDDDKNIQWARTAWEDIRGHSTGGTYINFLTEDEGDERTRSAFGKNYPRLVEVKTKWDPDNLFRVNKNILPRSR